MLAHLNIDSDASNIVPDAITVKAVEIPVTKAQAKVEVLLEDRVVPVSGFTKAMVKSMTEAMVRRDFYVFRSAEIKFSCVSKGVIKSMH